MARSGGWLAGLAVVVLTVALAPAGCGDDDDTTQPPGTGGGQAGAAGAGGQA
ncbi:MAG: hypothetical protein JRI23_26325, partial [Deltaproteobacteria bacterium]|nr:hypothetical protein [Deltaproteobacteria bacterium]